MNQNSITENYLADRQTRINSILNKILPSSETEPKKLHEAIRYSILNGGKRLRPIILYATGEIFGAAAGTSTPACALELIHCFSLVHDDLPAMDNDDYRRGKPTCHKAFSEATAILAGDGIQTLAVNLLADCDLFQAETKLKMIKCLGERSWEMMLGQAMDLDYNSQIEIQMTQVCTSSLDRPQGAPAVSKRSVPIVHEHCEQGRNKTDNQNAYGILEKIYLLKTGALIRAALELGIIAAGKDNSKDLNLLNSFGNALGLAYQIQDDIFDIAENMRQINPKFNYAALIGIDAAKKKTADLFDNAIKNIRSLSVDATLLISLAQYIMHRNH